MGSRSQTHHQLSSGLLVSGPPEQPKERRPTMGSHAVPYTGGDVKKSGELGKMFDISVVDPATAKSRPNSAGGSARSASHSGPVSRPSSSSGPLPPKKTSSGPLAPNLPATGLITSGPARRSGGQGDQTPKPRKKPGGGYGPDVTVLGKDAGYGFKIPKLAVWACVLVFVLGVVVGLFMLLAVKNLAILAAVGALLVPFGLLVLLNCARGRRGLEGYLRRFPEANLLRANIGDYVKVTGVVTCGSIPLETSYRGVSRCIFVSTELHEYRGWSGKPANPHHRCLTWGLRHSEGHVADFYISDNQGGTRALVRAGNGAKVVPFVKSAIKVEITNKNRELSPSSLSWLADHNLSIDDRIMRIGEGYIKEASIVSVVGILQRQDNVFMIVPPAEPVSTGCQWRRCLLPIYVEGLVLIGDKTPNDEVIIA